MKENRRLALSREHLVELTPDQLSAAQAGQAYELTNRGVCGNTADSLCTVRVTLDVC